MAKVSHVVTTSTRQQGGFDNLVANAKVFQRVYKGQKGGLKFQTIESSDGVPASTIGVYQLEAHKTTKGRILFPTASVVEFRKDLVADKVMTAKEAEKVIPGKFGTFFVSSK